MTRAWVTLRPAAIAAATSLAACAVGPEPAAPAIETPASYVSAAPEGYAQVDDRPWWEGFGDDGLNKVVAEVVARNLDVAAAIALVAEAGALEDATRSDLFPTFDGFAEGSYARALSGDAAGDDALDVGFGGAMAYTADVAGRNRRRVDAAIARFEAAANGVKDARRLAVQAAALQYIELRRSGSRLALLETSLELQSRTLEVVRARFDAGLSPALDVDRSAADLSRTRADRGVLRANRQAAAYALSVLSGEPPSDGGFGPVARDAIPEFREGPSIGAPAALLANRPDVRRAEAQLVAELATIGVEEADLYPSLRLPGQITAGSADILTAGVNQASVAISALVEVPLLDLGRRRAEVRAQRARAQGALVAWRSAILDAIVDVERSLVRIEALRARLVNLDEAVSSSENAYRQLDALYREGLTSFIDVLDAQRTLIATREAVVETKADLASEIVRLYSAVGAGSVDRGPSGSPGVEAGASRSVSEHAGAHRDDEQDGLRAAESEAGDGGAGAEAGNPPAEPE